MILHKRFMQFINKHKLIILQQFGFLPNHSTILALIDSMNEIIVRILSKEKFSYDATFFILL